MTAAEPTEAEAMEVAARFTRAACAVRDGDNEAAVRDLVGPFEPDNEKALADLYGMFSVAALLTGAALRKAQADPDDPAPFDGPAVLQLVDARTGLPGHPDDLPVVDRVTVWAAAAGANYDVDSITAHLHTLAGRDDGRGITKALVLLARICGACWDGDPLPSPPEAAR